MALQWSQPSTPDFTMPPAVDLSAMKALGEFGDNVSLTGRLSIGVEGPTPDEATVLGWLDVIYQALKADGWTADLRIEQAAVVRRSVEEAVDG